VFDRNVFEFKVPMNVMRAHPGSEVFGKVMAC